MRHPAIHLAVGELTGRHDNGEDACDHHQDEQDDQGLDECLAADLCSGFLVHGLVPFCDVISMPEPVCDFQAAIL